MRAALAALLLAPAAWAAPEPVVALDPRLETLGIVQLLSGGTPEGFVAPDTEYARRARKAFAKLKDHPAVKLTAALRPEFDYRHRTDAILRRGPLPKLAPRWFIPDYLVSLAGGPAAFEKWVSALASFGREGDVAGFARDNAVLLEPGFGEFRRDVARRGFMAKLEREAGVPFEGEYAVFASVFHLRGSQVNSVVRLEEGGHIVQSVVGAETANGGRVDFRPDDFVATAGHEISHGLYDAAAELSRARIARSRGAYAKLPWDCYGDWLQCVKETVVRAQMLRLVETELGAQSYRRHLEQEGPAKWPFLEPMVEKLKLYEKDRARWPDLYAFYPELLSVLPEAPAAPSTAPAPGAGPGPEWAYEETSPFATPGQRAHALRALDGLLAASPDDAELLVKRAAFRLSSADAAGAEKDAAAALAAAPANPGALLARGLARRALGRGDAASEDFAAAARACRAAASLDDSARVACGAALRAAGGGPLTAALGPDPSVGPGVVSRLEPLPPLARPGGDEGFEFAVDPRAELLAEVLASTPSAALPASALLSAALKAGLSPVAPAQLLFSYGPPPELAPRRAPPFGIARAFGGEAGMAAFVEALRAQAKSTGFAARWAADAPRREALLARARAEAGRTLSASAVSGWLGQSFPVRARFVISDALPSAYAANLQVEEGGRLVEIRMRSVLGWREKIAYFSFDDFGGCPAHELTHTVTDPLIIPRSAELAAYGSLMIPDCTDNWSGCVLEHVVLGVTLRALRAERGDAVYAATLAHYAARGFPYLPAMSRRLAEYETPAAREAGFAAFLPRALDAFRDELKGRARARAAGAAAPAPVEPAAAYAEEFRVDPRLDLVVLLRRLASAPEQRAREAAAAPEEAAWLDASFLRFSAHPAAALTERLDAVSPGLPPQLALHLSSAPGLAEAIPIPPGYRAAAGGGEAVDEWLEAARAFAAESRFFELHAARSAARERRLKTARDEAARALKAEDAAAYLGRPLSGRRGYALSPLYPASWPGRLGVYAASGAEVTRARAARPGRGGAESYGLDAPDASAARELVYEEAERLVPAAPGASGGIAEACADRGAPAWAVCEREHLVEAVLLRLRLRAGGEAAYRRARAGRDERAWPYLDAVLAKLQAYEEERARWTSLESFWPSAREAFGAAQAPRAEDAPGVEFAVDPRVELVSVLLRVSGAVRAQAGDSLFAREADERFAAFAKHPAAVRVAALARRGGAALPLRLALALGEPPALSDEAPPDAKTLALAGGLPAWRAFAGEARAFASEAGFWPYYDAARPRHAEFAARARAEARYGSSPEAARAYLGLPLPRKSRFLLAPLLTEPVAAGFVAKDAAGSVFVRAAAADSREPRFRFDSFSGSLVRELVRTATDPLAPEPARAYLASGVALRLLAADAGEPAAAAAAAALAGRGFPRLPELLAQLRVYERERAKHPSFASFAPRALAALAGPGGPDPKRVEAARRLGDEGVAAYAAGDATRAVELLTRAEALDPEAPSASLSLGVSLEKLGRKEASLAAYGRAIARALAEPRRHWEVAIAALSSRATALEAAGRSREARADLESARELAPDDWPGRAALDRRLGRR